MWKTLYDAAVKVQNARIISPFIEAGGVAAAILTKQGNIYVGVCIDTASTDFPEISESGKYRLVVENEAGITTELTFERKYVPNVAGSILIIVLSLAAATCLLVGLIWRNHSKTDD